MRLVNYFNEVGFFKVQLLLVIALLFHFSVVAQGSGELLFKSYCVACHTIGNGRLVGPDLIGVNEKYEEEWLVSFIQSSQSMVSAGDEKAVKIFNEYLVPMPDQPLDNLQVKEMLSYIKTQSEPLKEETVTETKDLNISKGVSTISTENRKFGYLDIVLLSVMGVETITILILINLLFVLIKTVKVLK